LSEQEVEVERVYTVPLSRAWIAARHRRTRRAINILREFAEHHMKSSEIKIDTDLNEELWRRGITKPPRRITVKMEKDEDGVVTISLPKESKRRAEEIPPPLKEEESITQSAVETPSSTAPQAQAPAPANELKKEEPPTKKDAKKPAPKKKPKKSSVPE